MMFVYSTSNSALLWNDIDCIFIDNFVQIARLIKHIVGKKNLKNWDFIQNFRYIIGLSQFYYYDVLSVKITIENSIFVNYLNWIINQIK